MIAWYSNRIRMLKVAKKKGQLAFEIALILLVKMLLLWLLWALCFSHPVPKELRQIEVTRLILNQSH